ncbi:MAG: aminotransferase class V-fold PLP-dependent enzyme, partial [Candidatus Thermoplasmatota archaeon]
MKKIYLDHAATTPVDKEVIEEMMPYFNEKFGNASSLHLFGREAKKGIEEARERVAKLINADADRIIFTGSGTESDNLAIKGVAFSYGKGHIITSKIEHPA